MASLVAMAAFARVVEMGSFTAAARELGLSTPVVSKRISELEHKLGTRLLYRTTRKLSLTEAGSAFYRHCARLVEEAKLAEETVAQMSETPRGLLRITAPFTIGSSQVAPVIPEFLARYPEINIEMILNDRVVDLAEEGFDLAIRFTGRPQPNLAAKRLITTNRVICASPDYWFKHGKPQTPAELAQHNCILYASVPMPNAWVFHGQNGEERIQVHGNFWVNSPDALREIAVAGLGVVRLPSVIINREIATGQLETVLDDYAAPGADIYAMYLPNRYLSKKIRVFIDFLANKYTNDNASTRSHKTILDN